VKKEILFLLPVLLLSMKLSYAQSSITQQATTPGLDQNKEVFKYYDEDKDTILGYLARKGEAGLINSYIKDGYDVKATYGDDQRTALHDAVYSDRKNALQIAKALIDASANVNAQTIYGVTPLVYANTPEMVDLLVRSGAVVNKPAKRPFIMYVVRFKSPEVLRRLLEYGLNVHMRTNNGRNALQAAIDRRDDLAPAVIKELIRWGINVNNVDDYGNTVLDTLYNEKSEYKPETYNQVLKLLKGAGAHSSSLLKEWIG
jgi:ankyrin repeat protein